MVEKLHLDLWASGLRWAARSVGAVLAALVAGVFVGNLLNGTALADAARMQAAEWVLALALAAMIAGSLAAWRWELVGGAVTCGSALAFILITSALIQQFRIRPVEAAFVLVGALFMLSEWLDPGGEA
ncbi:MAG TPA: hypothetical protein VKY39_02910 [Aggregatilineales bacterium]|jgi:hypothetical protein|nr:hypothetical protein [Aggregatilineales bacterium]